MATKSKTVSATASAAKRETMEAKRETMEAKRETTENSPAAEPMASSAAKNLREAAHFNLLQLGDLIQNRLGRVLREYDLTLSQYQVLRILEHAGTALPSLEISARMPQVAPAITGLLTRLDEQGFVRRKQHKQDKRVTQVEIAPKAKTLLKKLEKPVLDLHASLTEALNDADLKQLSKLVEKALRGS